MIIFFPFTEDLTHLSDQKLQYPCMIWRRKVMWNGHGYDVAKIFDAKFSTVSPVKLQIVRKFAGEFAINGGHDIDKAVCH
ncbi:Chitinase domain-containing protein 1 [Holothuria leucospilota]|uniref:Chitinase domain-containing protein 1 n=1 Tax=Holothuria leucospilota TaxID=206669 RepID=A0A9Q0Y9D4_HOLLE|nr:Chitinase domain-containing protein 1 [Holothuria leucospilota]